MLECRDLSGVVNGEEELPSDESSPEFRAYATKVREARAVFVNALGDRALRVVQLCNMPRDM